MTRKKKISSVSCLLSLTIIGLMTNFYILLAQPAVKKQRLQVSSNGRFLVYQDGTPFFYLGDTAWELFHRLNREEVLFYLDNRKEKGFTVIQAVALAELDGLHTPNALGDTPLYDDDPTKPNEAYFKQVDWVIDRAAERGIYIALLPFWGDKLSKRSWGIGPEIFNAENAYAYGRFLGERYREKWNLIWIAGGDRNPETAEEVAVWRSLAAGIVKGVGGQDRALMSFHPQPTSTGGSSTWFHQDEWLDFNMNQTGHCRNDPSYQKIAYDYALLPVKPTMDGEPTYEEHPICFNAKENGYSNAHDVRVKAYWHVFYGAHGHTYGCHAVWQMADKGREPVNGPLRSWKESLDLPGATQMQYLKKLLLSRPFLERIPDQQLVASSNPDDSLHISATRDRAGRYAMLYFPYARNVTVNTTKLAGNEVQVWWYNPKTGKSIHDGKRPKQPTMDFTPPQETDAEDWVLVLDDSTAGFNEPGTVQQF